MGPRVSVEMVEAARDGGASEIERLLEAVWDDAYRLSRAIVGQSQGAQDAAQESCVTMFRNIATLRDAQAFRTWFYRIVVREALNQKQRLPASVGIPPDTSYRDDPSASIDLWRALAELGEKHRTAIVLHYFEGLSTREIAGVLRVPEATVRFRLMTARRRLKPLLVVFAPDAPLKDGKLYAR